MMTRTRTTLMVAFLVGGTLACRASVPCSDYNGVADDKANDDEDMQLPDLPDLPCGGADLKTDNLNCGTCGHECILWFEETQYAAGTCAGGVCGPGWSNCAPGGPNPYPNCAVVCEGLGQSCVPNGCSGYTGMLFGVLFGWGCGPDESEPSATMMGECDEPIPWEKVEEDPPHVMCCCDFQ